MVEILSLATALVLVAVGVVLSYFGYETAQKLLAIAGAAGGFAAGIFLASAVVPAVTGQNFGPAVILIAALAGSVLGRLFVPALGPLAFGLAGFAMSSLAALAFLSRGRILDVLLAAIPSGLAAANPAAVLERIASAPLFQDPNFEQALLLSAGVGVVGGLIALRLYAEFVAVVTTLVGASMLGLAIPIVLEAFRGETITTGAGEFSFVWFALALVTGVAFEFWHNRDEMDVL